MCYKTKPNYTSQIAKLIIQPIQVSLANLAYVENPQTPTLEPKVAFLKKLRKKVLKNLLIENQTIKGYFETYQPQEKEKREREPYLSLLREGINESDIARPLSFAYSYSRTEKLLICHFVGSWWNR